MRNHLWRLLSVIGLICLGAFVSHAERLPVRQYTVADGLAHGSVLAIHQDARGFLWLATRDGLSRFDGYRFTNYGVNDGLGHAHINDVVQDRRGRLWVATNGGGVALLLDETTAAQRRKRFINFLIAPEKKDDYTNQVNRILFDADNRLWCETDTGLFRAKSLEIESEQFERISAVVTVNSPPILSLDRCGRVWASLNDQLLKIEGGKVASYQLWQEAGETTGNVDYRWVKGMVELSDGRILIATQKDLYEFIEPATTYQRGSWRRLPLTLPMKNTVGNIHPAMGGGLWIGTDGSLIRYRYGQQLNYHLGNDPNPFKILAVFSDRDGNLWMGTRQRGLLKLMSEAVLIYDTGDGLPPVMDVYWLRETHDGRMTLYGRRGSLQGCNETFLVGDGLLSHLPSPLSLCVHDVLQDSRKNWWALHYLVDRKIYKLRFISGPKLDLSAGYELTAEDGWVDGGYNGLYEDHEGIVWLRKGHQIFRIEYTNSGRPRIVEVVKRDPHEKAAYLIRGRSGELWWSNGGTVWRQQAGKIEIISLPAEKPSVRNFFVDHKGRLWISTLNAGVFMTETPTAEQPRFTNYSTANGLIHNYVEDVCEDDDGNLWFGTLRGLYRLNEQIGHISPVSFAENSLGSAVRQLHKDKRGYIWASMIGAVIRINPHLLPPPALQVPIYLNRVSIAGEPLALGETGTVTISPLELPAGRNNLDIEFVSPNFRSENAVQYQFKLEGADNDWSVPGSKREVNYARLSPGSYTFLARAVGEAGIVSAEPASLRFTILRPVWQRWWFVAGVIMGLGALGYGGYRYRLSQAVKVERVRTRIAHDLHDDIGANLTRISILSEVAKQQRLNGAPPPGELLDSIAEISRESVAAMNDIVWAINPEHDSLLDLTSRMRRHAEEVFTTRDVRLNFEAPDDAEQLKLDIETRRDLYLIFKEAVNNAARHADCSAVSIRVQTSATHIQLSVVDNGKGFDPTALAEGNGLLSMRNRAQEMKGRLKIESSPGKGSELSLTVPVSPA